MIVVGIVSGNEEKENEEKEEIEIEQRTYQEQPLVAS